MTHSTNKAQVKPISSPARHLLRQTLEHLAESDKDKGLKQVLNRSSKA